MSLTAVIHWSEPLEGGKWSAKKNEGFIWNKFGKKSENDKNKNALLGVGKYCTLQRKSRSHG